MPVEPVGEGDPLRLALRRVDPQHVVEHAGFGALEVDVAPVELPRGLCRRCALDQQQVQRGGKPGAVGPRLAMEDEGLFGRAEHRFQPPDRGKFRQPAGGEPVDGDEREAKRRAGFLLEQDRRGRAVAAQVDHRAEALVAVAGQPRGRGLVRPVDAVGDLVEIRPPDPQEGVVQKLEMPPGRAPGRGRREVAAEAVAQPRLEAAHPCVDPVQHHIPLPAPGP